MSAGSPSTSTASSATEAVGEGDDESRPWMSKLGGIVNESSVNSMIATQTNALRRFEKANKMMENCNRVALEKLPQVKKEAAEMEAILAGLRTDLEYIFRKLRNYKTSLAAAHPELYEIHKQAAAKTDDDQEE